MGKAYANRKSSDERPENDFYPTPKGLVYELINTGELEGYKTILEPACGKNAIVDILRGYGFDVTAKDLILGNDFLEDDYTGQKFDCIITNPPFDLWNKFVEKAKTIDCKKIVFIGKTNYFGSHERNVSGIWNELSDVYVFDRQVEYRTPQLDIPNFCVGALVTGWFVWTKGYKSEPKIHVIDVQKYATLGSVDHFLTQHPEYDGGATKARVEAEKLAKKKLKAKD